MAAAVEKKTRYFKGGGKFYFGGRRLGQISQAALTLEIESTAKENFEGGGGNDEVLITYKSVSLELTCRNFDLDNLALCFGADVKAMVGVDKTDYPITAMVNGLSRVDGLIDTTQTVVVTNAGTPVDEAMYRATAAGITIIDDSIPDDTELLVSYKQANHTKLEAAVNKGIEKFLCLEGVNDAATGESHVIDFHKALSTPMESFDFISNEDQDVTMKFEVLADTSKGVSGEPESPFFRFQQLGVVA